MFESILLISTDRRILLRFKKLVIGGIRLHRHGGLRSLLGLYFFPVLGQLAHLGMQSSPCLRRVLLIQFWDMEIHYCLLLGHERCF